MNLLMEWGKGFLSEVWEARLRFLKFSVVGAVVFLLGTAIVFLVVDLAGYHPYTAYVIELVVTLQLSFLLNDVFTFEAVTRAPNATLPRRWVQFHTVRLPIAGVEGIMAAFFLSILSPWGIYSPHLVANGMAILLGMGVSFWVLWKWTYRK